MLSVRKARLPEGDVAGAVGVDFTVFLPPRYPVPLVALEQFESVVAGETRVEYDEHTL